MEMDGDEVAIAYIKDVTFNTSLPDAEILKMTKVRFYLQLKSLLRILRYQTKTLEYRSSGLLCSWMHISSVSSCLLKGTFYLAD